MQLGNILAQLRNKKGLNQRELAKELGVSNGAVAMWETNKRQPDLEMMKKLSSFFNVPIDDLLSNEIAKNSDKTNVTNEEGYFYFFFNEDDLLRSTFSKRIKTAIADIGMTEDEFKEVISLDSEKVNSLLSGSSDPTARDLIELSQSLNTSIDYLLGQVPKVSNAEKKLLNAFVKLNEDNQDIIIGKAKELLKEQRYDESVAADEQLKEAK